jgi:hypothetical protein
MLELIAEKKGPQHYGEEFQESEEQQAQRLVGEMLREANWKEEALERRGKGDARKARMAARLRAETTLTWSWIAQRLDGPLAHGVQCGATERFKDQGLAVPAHH